MKNKIALKKYLFLIFTLSIVFVFINVLINSIEYKKYMNNFNRVMNATISTIKNNYPSITDEEIIDIINSKESNEVFFNNYGIDKDESIISENEKEHKIYLIINAIFYLLGLILLIISFIIYENIQGKKIDDITKYIKEINKRNYKLNLDDNTEDELSILKSEIYKTTIMLKESALNSNKDKIELKKSLEDISHQLKTPLTSIIIMLDNIIDNPEMDDNIKNEFINDIKREIDNINHLVQILLKLSKLDSNTIEFNRKENSIKSIINKAIKNVSILCDLKNVKIILKSDDYMIKSDFTWEVEAITNIIKNCVEHSHSDSIVDIEVSDNNSYLMVAIKDYGDIIAKEDINHIFERFYKGKNSKSDSIGIGLSLAKSIIEKDNGSISVESGEYTKFTIKFFKI